MVRFSVLPVATIHRFETRCDAPSVSFFKVRKLGGDFQVKIFVLALLCGGELRYQNIVKISSKYQNLYEHQNIKITALSTPTFAGKSAILQHFSRSTRKCNLSYLLISDFAKISRLFRECRRMTLKMQVTKQELHNVLVNFRSQQKLLIVKSTQFFRKRLMLSLTRVHFSAKVFSMPLVGEGFFDGLRLFFPKILCTKKKSFAPNFKIQKYFVLITQ